MADEGFKRKLAAILSADVEGYSRLMDDSEEATIQTLNTYRNSMSTLIEQHRGRVVDTTGDNLLAEFTSVVDAVNCSVEIQRKLDELNKELPSERKMKFRIGVNVGDVVEEEDRIYGDGVNIAARVEGMAEAGGICITGRAFDQVKNKLKLGYEFLGEHGVKNIAEPVRVYKILMEPEAVGKVIGEKRFLGRFSRRTALAAIITLGIVAGGLIGWNIYLQQSKKIEPAAVEKMAFPLPEKPSIAVLPFDNMSGDPEQDYIGDGFTENIITGLSKIPEMFVIARNSVFTYKGKSVNIKQVSEELGVKYVLEGSIQKAGDRLRVNTQLIDALKGHHLWAERYDRELKDLFILQDEITKEIITAMQVKLTRGDAERLYAKGTDNLEAYLKCLQAREILLGALPKEKNVLARRLAEEAINLDPNYSQAYRELAQTYVVEVWIRTTKSPRKSLERAVELTQKAISLDNSNAHAYSLLAEIYLMLRQYDKALIAVERSYALEPNSPQVLYRYGRVLYSLGRWEEALPLYEEAMRLNPIPPNILLRRYGTLLRELERYDEAIAVLKRAIAQEPEKNLWAYLALTVTYSLTGHDEQARETAKEVLRINPKFSVKYLEKKITFKNPAHTARLTTEMRKAGLPD
jgi:adenylate cyclase